VNRSIDAGDNRSEHTTTNNELRTMKQKVLLALVTGVLTLVSNSDAEQVGSGHYVSGATASFIDALPGKPGFVVENIFLDYNDANAGARLPFGDGEIALNLNANVYADSLFMMYTFTPEILGGHYAVATAIPYEWSDVKATGTIDINGVFHSASRSDWATGLGDIEFWPFMLGWTNGDIKYDVRCAVYAPSGEYHASQLANVGLGYWTFEPELTFSWLSSKIGTEVSVFAGMDFNTKNTDADYQSGDIFHIDATVTQHLPLFGGTAGAGASGFYYKQLTADSGSGAKLGSFEARSEGVGPVVSYLHNIGTKQLAIEARWLPQTDAQNTTKGSFIWVKIALVF
jgi:hypothetical protein